MRPGPIGPGNSAAKSCCRMTPICFNEARPNWAGKLRLEGGYEDREAGFNEARPNWAGKFGSRSLPCLDGFGFNEARPNWAGKSYQASCLCR